MSQESGVTPWSEDCHRLLPWSRRSRPWRNDPWRQKGVTRPDTHPGGRGRRYNCVSDRGRRNPGMGKGKNCGSLFLVFQCLSRVIPQLFSEHFTSREPHRPLRPSASHNSRQCIVLLRSGPYPFGRDVSIIRSPRPALRGGRVAKDKLSETTRNPRPTSPSLHDPTKPLPPPLPLSSQ